MSSEKINPRGHNERPRDSRAGSGPRDINGPAENKIPHPSDIDRDKKADYGVSRELSEQPPIVK